MSTINKFWNGVFWSYSTLFFKLVVGLGSSIVFVRYLGASDYGLVVVLMDFLMLVAVLLSGGLGIIQSRVLPRLITREEFGQARSFLQRINGYRMAIATSVSILGYLNLDWIQATLFPAMPRELLIAVLLSIPVQMLGTCMRGALEVTFQQKLTNLADLSALVLKLVNVLPVIYFDLGVVWFFFANLLSDVIVTVFFVHAARTRVWLRYMKTQLVPYTGPIWLAGATMMLIMFSSQLLGKEIGTQMLSLRLGEQAPEVVTLYSLAFVLVSRCLLFTGIGGSGLSNLTQAALSEMKTNGDDAAVRSLYTYQMQMYSFIAFPMMIGGAVVGPDVLTLMYGDLGFKQSALIPITFVLLLPLLLMNINYTLLFVYERERFLLYNRVLWGGSNAVLCYFFAIYGAFGVVACTASCLVLCVITETFVARKSLNLQIPVRFLAKICLAAALMGACLITCDQMLKENSVSVRLLSNLFVGVFSYVIALYLLSPFDRQQIAGSTFLQGAPKRLLLQLAK